MTDAQAMALERGDRVVLRRYTIDLPLIVLGVFGYRDGELACSCGASHPLGVDVVRHPEDTATQALIQRYVACVLTQVRTVDLGHIAARLDPDALDAHECASRLLEDIYVKGNDE